MEDFCKLRVEQAIVLLLKLCGVLCFVMDSDAVSSSSMESWQLSGV